MGARQLRCRKMCAWKKPVDANRFYRELFQLERVTVFNRLS
jgi:hypothetical protein